MPVSQPQPLVDPLDDDAPVAPGEVASAHHLLIGWSIIRAVTGFIAAGVFATAVGFGVEDHLAAEERAAARAALLASWPHTGGTVHRGDGAVVVESTAGFALIVDDDIIAVGAKNH